MRTTMMQFKSVLGAIDENFARAERLIERAMSDAPDVIVLPELWSTGYYPTPLEEYADVDGRRTLEFLTRIARRAGVNVIGGSVLVSSGGRFYNRSYAIDRLGELRAEYDKVHLFSMAGEERVFASGERLCKFELDGVMCSTVICYDLRFPEVFRRLALEGVGVVFMPAAWSLRRLEHWRVLSRARAIEEQMFVVAVNSAGHSMVIDPWGEVLIEGGSSEEILSAEIDLGVKKSVAATMNVFSDRKPTLDRI